VPGDPAEEGVQLLSPHGADRRQRPGHVADDRLLDLALRSRVEQPEGLPVVHRLEDEPAAVGADVQRPFQGAMAGSSSGSWMSNGVRPISFRAARSPSSIRPR
jgi:hypothetical protein